MKKVYLIALAALAFIMIESLILTKINHSNSIELAKKKVKNDSIKSNQKQNNSVSREPASENHTNNQNIFNSKTNEQSRIEFVKIEEKIKKLKLCLSEQNCDFPQNDPRQYDIKVNHEIANELKKIKELIQNQQLHEQMMKIANTEFQSENGFVQQAALEILSQLPISLDAIQAIESGLDNSSNPRIVELTIEELKRYQNSDYQIQVTQIMANMITNTGVFAAKTASDAVFTFINEQNLNQFEGVYQKLTKNTTVAKNLKAAIDEYKRLKTGG